MPYITEPQEIQFLLDRYCPKPDPRDPVDPLELSDRIDAKTKNKSDTN